MRPSIYGANHENFSRVITLVRQLISNRELVEWSGDEVDMHLAKQVVLSLEFSTQHRKQLALEKRVKDLKHDKESLRSDFEAAQESVQLMRGMVEKARREYLAQVQETIKTEILMGQAVSSLDCTVVELRAETSSLRQLNSQIVGELESTKEAAAAGEKRLEEVVGKLSEAASSLAAITTERDAAEASKQKLEGENADLMNVGVDALIDGFELALEQIRCILPDLDLSQFSIYHEVVDGKLIDPAC